MIFQQPTHYTMKTTIYKITQMFLYMGMLFTAGSCLAAPDTGTLSDEIKEKVIASTPRICEVANCDIYDAGSKKLVQKDKLMLISSGTGILIHKSDTDAYVLTNAHVIQENDAISVEEIDPEHIEKLKPIFPSGHIAVHMKEVFHLAFFPNGAYDPRIYIAREVVCKNQQDASNQGIDAAVLRIAPQGLPEPLVIDTTKLEETQSVVAIGYPGKLDRRRNFVTSENTPLLRELQQRIGDYHGYHAGYISFPFNVSDRDFINPAITLGHVNRYDETPGMPQRIIHSASVDHGNSGGPLIDPVTGYVVGLNTQIMRESTALSVAQSASTIVGFLRANNIPIPEPHASVPFGIIAGIIGGLALIVILLLLIVSAARVGKTSLGIIVQGRRYDFKAGRLRKGILLGRSSEADVTVSDPTVSSRHACIVLRNERLFLEDLGSKGGTKINGTLVPPHAPHPISSGCTITLTHIDVRLL